MKHCAFLTIEDLDDFECYDQLLVEPLRKNGWEVHEVPWRRKNTDWDRFDIVIIRSPWDYYHDPEKFLDVLENIDHSSARLENSLEMVRWNIDKRYLRDIQAKGIPIVPTHWRPKWGEQNITSFFKLFDAEEIIIKPVISAGADCTFRLQKYPPKATLKEIRSIFAEQPFMVQPMMQNIIEEGEFSLFYFSGTYSHTVLKTPKQGDFRVQEEHGGQLRLIKPEKKLKNLGKQTMQMLHETPLYARIDFVRTSDNHFALMELELIEPSLYFNMDPESPERFVKALEQHIR